jgi:hypothetical protein
LGLALIAVVAYLVIRSRKSPLEMWRAKAREASTLGTSLFQGLAADLATAAAQGPPREGFPQRMQTIDVLAGQLAELASGQGDPAAATSLSGLRDELDELRTAIRGLEGPVADPQGAVQQATQRLGRFETALQRFEQSVHPQPGMEGGGIS